MVQRDRLNGLIPLMYVHREIELELINIGLFAFSHPRRMSL